MKHFTSVGDVPNLKALLQKAMELKRHPGSHTSPGTGKTLGLIFFNPSLRTRLSTQIAAQNLGMNVIVMNVDQDGWKLETKLGIAMDGDKSEHIKDAVGVMGQYCDILGVRTFAQLKNKEEDDNEEVLNSFVKYAGVPVLSLESSIRHPLQSFADLITIEEYKKKEKPKVVLSWAPHPKALPQAVPNSFVEWMKKMEYELLVTHPEGYELPEEFMKGVKVEYDQHKAFAGADFIYAKNWSSYQHYGQILNKDPKWMIDTDKMKLTNEAKFMHCLPVRRNVVVSDAVLDSENSLILPQAKNRITSAQTVLNELLTLGK